VRAPAAGRCSKALVERAGGYHAGRVRICLHDDPGQFARTVRTLLDADPVRHTMALTVVEGMRSGRFRAAHMLTVRRRGEVVGATLRTEGYPVLVSALPAEHAVAADAAAAAVDPCPDGVSGPVPEAEAYAAAVAARAGTGVAHAVRLRLWRLCGLRAPAGVSGAARRAGPGDRELLAGWLTAFVTEAMPQWAVRETEQGRRSDVRDVPAPGTEIMLWEDGGRPVAFAQAGVPVAGMSRVGPVYTPAEHRGRGYGTAVTAATTAWALDAGAREVVLFTDLANPVSNAIYPRIGYRPVLDTVDLAFQR